MVLSELNGFFTACSAVAGSLIGLLFVAITLRYDAIFGAAALRRNRSIAYGAFTALVNALTVSLFALVPFVHLGYPVAVVAALSLVATFRTHGLAGLNRPFFYVSAALYAFQFVDGALLIAVPSRAGLADALVYLVISAFLTALMRSWQLLQVEGEQAPAAEG